MRRLGGCLVQPGGFRLGLPRSEALAQAYIAQLLLAGRVVLLVQRQGLVEDEPTGASEAAPVAHLVAVGHQRESLETQHRSLVWSISDDNEIQRCRHCVFKMHVR